MTILLRLRVIVALLVAVLMPLEIGHCALMPWQASAIVIGTDHQTDDDHDCCPESAPSQEAPTPTESCCCGNIQLSAATATALVTVDAPTSTPRPFAVVAMTAAADGVQSILVRLEPDARSGSPPDPSTAPQSPRSPPYSA
jgi:hypothetical protein